jgi:broad specificity phosphatase PhoE
VLIVVRHAHRDKLDGGAADNGLSEKGTKQALRVARYYRRLYGEQAPRLVSSPKRRCIETLDPLAKDYHLTLEVNALLDEGDGLLSKIHRFLTWWESCDDRVVLICSHGDLIPALFRQAIGKKIELDKGGWSELVLEGDKFRLRSLIQKLAFK